MGANTEPFDLDQFMHAYMQREKQQKLLRYHRLNRFAQKGQIVFAGSSLMEQFPIYEFLMTEHLPYVIYNRGIGGFTTEEFLAAMDVCVFELAPAHLFLNIGTNDLNGPDYEQAALLARYERILQQIRLRLPDTRLYLMAYYPVNPTAADDRMKAILRFRTNERIRAASEGVRGLAERYGAGFLDLNEGLVDSAGELKAEYTVEGMHMYADGYWPVFRAMLPTLERIRTERAPGQA